MPGHYQATAKGRNMIEKCIGKDMRVSTGMGNAIITRRGKIKTVDDCLEISKVVQSVFASDSRYVFLNVVHCKVLSGSFVGFVVHLNHMAKELGIRFSLVVKANSRFHQLVQLTRLDESLAVGFEKAQDSHCP